MVHKVETEMYASIHFDVFGISEQYILLYKPRPVERTPDKNYRISIYHSQRAIKCKQFNKKKFN